ncbi:hypothetical protein B0H34DRAFT_545832 [Crassisporium funariophilum]|nr:hypothetical protein B0H34DRAFT_545832 [Crassisporium funariophilum]
MDLTTRLLVILLRGTSQSRLVFILLWSTWIMLSHAIYSSHAPFKYHRNKITRTRMVRICSVLFSATSSSSVVRRNGNDVRLRVISFTDVFGIMAVRSAYQIPSTCP